MGKAKKNVSANQDTTQPIHSPSHSGKEEDPRIRNCGDAFMQEDTVPFEDDDAWINDDEYTETQVMDDECDKETQYVDLGFGTQEEPLVEEEEDQQLIQGSDGLDTQVLDRFDEEEDVVVADSDDDATVFLEDNSSERDISDCGGANLLLSEDKAGELANENIKSTVDSLSKHAISGKVARFASVRSAAFRSSARLAAQKLLNSDCSTLPNSHSSGQGVKQNVGEAIESGLSSQYLCRKEKRRKQNSEAALP